MEIVKADIIGYYSFKPDIHIKQYGETKEDKNKKCMICLRSIYDPSYETISNNNNILNKCGIELGCCGHMFHSDCINDWLKTSGICPIDKVKWWKHQCFDINKNSKQKKKLNEENKNNSESNNIRRETIQEELEIEVDLEENLFL